MCGVRACLVLAEGHFLYNLRVIPTVDKKLSRDPKYNYEFAFQESLHKVSTVPAFHTATSSWRPVCG